MAAHTNLGLFDWNWVELMLHEAMIGSISPNFRVVELAFEEMQWASSHSSTRSPGFLILHVLKDIPGGAA